jgi:hypothetical protein
VLVNPGAGQSRCWSISGAIRAIPQSWPGAMGDLPPVVTLGSFATPASGHI